MAARAEACAKGGAGGSVCTPLFYYSIIGTRIQHLHKIYITIRPWPGWSSSSLPQTVANVHFPSTLLAFAAATATSAWA